MIFSWTSVIRLRTARTAARNCSAVAMGVGSLKTLMPLLEEKYDAGNFSFHLIRVVNFTQLTFYENQPLVKGESCSSSDLLRMPSMLVDLGHELDKGVNALARSEEHTSELQSRGLISY